MKNLITSLKNFYEYWKTKKFKVEDGYYLYQYKNFDEYQRIQIEGNKKK